ncbi:TonB-dependent receptor [Persicobacter psychrovividus]|uniref:Ligand-gated channel n=1 Tax=Persicobacter psychrovividus TaxID=387638 RepID=A0ABN6LF24_9BACT|nr:ligand-gated channel [Persicobacter psychrovividus]
MKKIFTVFLLLLSIHAFAQSSISGKVTNEANQPLPFVNVAIKNSSVGTITDETGFFKLPPTNSTSGILLISCMGYESQAISLQQLPQKEQLHITLIERATKLQQVEIIGRKSESYKGDYTFTATKTGMPLKDVPQSVATVTKELMLDQQATKLGEVVQNVSGVSQFTAYNDLTIRGFRSKQSHLVNGLRTAFSFWAQPNVNIYEKVEVIKGPASAMFANTRPGGTVNFTTKKPLQVERKQASFGVGSFNTVNTNIDFTGPIDKSDKFFYRLNAGYQSSDGFRDMQESKSFYLAPSFSFIPTENSRFNVDIVYQNDDQRLDRGQAVPDQSTDLSVTSRTNSTAKTNDFMNLANFYMTMSYNQKISSWLSFNTSYIKFNMNGGLGEHRTNRKFISDQELEMRYVHRDELENADNISSYFVAEANTGAIKHTILAGLDYSLKTYDKSEWVAIGEKDGVDNYKFFAPDNGFADIDTYNRSVEIARNGSAYTQNHTIGYYIQDQIQYNKLQLLLGLRKEFYTDTRLENGQEQDKNQTALLPRIGLVFALTPQINFYGTYTEGFEPQDYKLNTEQNGGPFDPLKSAMFEVGTKGEFYDGKLSATIAAYQINVDNVLVKDPYDPDKLEQRGGETSKGVEFDLSGQLTKNFNLTANYAYNHASITASDDPSEIGRQKENAPYNQGGFWLKYQVVSGKAKGLGFGFGGHYVGDRLTNVEGLTFENYTLFDAGIYYQLDKMRVSANLKNIFDQEYYIGGYGYDRLFPGRPRNFMVNLSFKI